MINEMVVPISDLRDGDMVRGSDGKWYEVETLPIHTPERMYELTFENGKVRCSGDHEWTFFDDANQPFTISTDTIYSEFTIADQRKWADSKSFIRTIGILMNKFNCKPNGLDTFYLSHCGSKNGPALAYIKRIDPVPSRCIALKGSNDKLFEIYTDNLSMNGMDTDTFEVERDFA